MSGRKPNWLLRGLIVVSLCIHLLLFLHVSGIYSARALRYIELTLHDVSKPSLRSIPRPRHRPKLLPEQEDIKRLSVTQQLIPQLKPIKMEPPETDLSESLVEAVSVPDIPAMRELDITNWSLADAYADYAASYSYLDLVRLRIEREKEYPEVARTQKVEGQVVIRFVITPEGGVRALEVAKASNSPELDNAALRAVRDAAPYPKPPRRIFKGEVPLELTIVFELT